MGPLCYQLLALTLYLPLSPTRTKNLNYLLMKLGALLSDAVCIVQLTALMTIYFSTIIFAVLFIKPKEEKDK